MPFGLQPQYEQQQQQQQQMWAGPGQFYDGSYGGGAAGHSMHGMQPHGMDQYMGGGMVPPENSWGWGQQGPTGPMMPGSGFPSQPPGPPGPPWILRPGPKSARDRNKGTGRSRVPGGGPRGGPRGNTPPGFPAFPGGPDLGPGGPTLPDIPVLPGSPSPSSGGMPLAKRSKEDMSPSDLSGGIPPPPPGATPSLPPEGGAGKSGKGGPNNAASKKRYTCEVCQKRFSTAWYVRVHRKSHSGERPYVCHNCGKGFMLPNVLQVHLRKCEKHNQGGAGMPGGGSKKGGSKANNNPPVGPPSDIPGGDLNNPESSPLPQQQQQQQPGFLDAPPVGGGWSNNGPPPPGPMDQFNQRYDGPPQMGMGGMPTPPFHHGGGMPPFNADHQGGGAPYMEHHAPHLTAPPPDMNSPGGGGGPDFGSQSGLPAHFLANERPPDEGGGAYDQNNHSPSLLTQEPSPSDKVTPRPHPCEVCDKRFSQKCNLITHMRLHTGERPYGCTFCEKRFTQKGNLDAHIKTHGGGVAAGGGVANNKPFNCGTCGKKFASKGSLVSHARHSHADSPFDEISALKSGHAHHLGKITDLPPSPSFSPGIPTPQSSLDSLSCYPNSNAVTPPVNNPGTTVNSGDQPRMMPGNLGMPGSDPLSELTATVEAAPRPAAL